MKIFNAIKIFIKIGILCVFGVVIVLYVSAALRVKKLDLPNDTSNKVAGFYALDDKSIDVLFLGTSHSYYAFNPGVFYEKTGLNSYVFAGECQPIGVTYHYFIEALKTQKPQIVVLDLFSLLPSSQGCQTDGIIQKNVEDLKPGRNKVKALDLISNEEDRKNAKFDLLLYRNRWSEAEDEEWEYPLEYHFNDDFGYTMGWPGSNEVYERPVYYTTDQLRPIESQLSYLEYIVSLAQENDIQLILFKTPFYEEEEDFKTMNMLAEFAYLHGLPILDLNLDYSSYNFRFDVDGDVWHCNVRGSIKVTNYLADYINNNYDIDSYNSDVYKEKYDDLYLRTLKTLLWSGDELSRFSKLLEYTDLTLVVSYCSQQDELNIKDGVQEYLYEIGIDLDLSSEYNYNYGAIISKGQVIEQVKSLDEIEFSSVIENNYVYINTRYDSHTYINDENMTSFYSGINLVILDNITGDVVATLCIDIEDDFKIH